MSGRTRDGGTAAAAVTGDPEALRVEIERTRAELGETIAALAAKADVRARAREKLGAMTSRARHKAAAAGGAVRVRPARPLAGVVVLGVVAVALVAWRRNGRRR